MLQKQHTMSWTSKELVCNVMSSVYILITSREIYQFQCKMEFNLIIRCPLIICGNFLFVSPKLSCPKNLLRCFKLSRKTFFFFFITWECNRLLENRTVLIWSYQGMWKSVSNTDRFSPIIDKNAQLISSVNIKFQFPATYSLYDVFY